MPIKICLPSYYLTRRIFAFTRALCLGETLVLLDVVLQGFFGNDGLSCNCFCIGMLKMQGYYLCIQAEVTFNEQYYKLIYRRPKLKMLGVIFFFVQRSVTYGIYCYITTNLTTRKRDSCLQHMEVLYWAACG